MGIVRADSSPRTLEMEEFKRTLLACAGVDGKEDGKEEDIGGGVRAGSAEEEDEEGLVCVTSGVSYLGLAIVSRLLLRGYAVRVIVHREGNPQRFFTIACSLRRILI